MSALLETPPDATAYRYVVRRHDKDADHGDAQPIAFATYTEATDSRAIEIDGVVAHTLFLASDEAFQRAVRLGWQDCTAEWMQKLEDAKPKLTTPSQRAIFAALTDEWQDKGQLVRTSGITDSEWRTTIRLLEEKGLAACNLSARERRKAHERGNAGYRYRRGLRAGELDGV